MNKQTSDYFKYARIEVLPFLPPKLEKVLELGAASGATLTAIKKRYPNLWGYGIELDENAAQIARGVFDIVKTGFIEDVKFENDIAPESLDLVLCMDVLEHLVDPWEAVHRIVPLMRSGGRMIISVPNVRNFKFLMRLLFNGDFHYTDAGILDRTHLRFFTFETAQELGTKAGLKPIYLGGTKPPKPLSAKGIIKAISFGALEPIMQKQVLVVLEK
jgi:SAM-dependent methyltransferase